MGEISKKRRRRKKNRELGDTKGLTIRCQKAESMTAGLSGLGDDVMTHTAHTRIKSMPCTELS